MKSIDEKKYISRAYSEVLGIKKYIDLRDNMEDLRIRFRRNSATERDRNRFNALQVEMEKAKDLIKVKQERIIQLKEKGLSKRLLAEQYQEKLIREGNSITPGELANLRKAKVRLSSEYEGIKSRLKDMLDLAPFAIAGLGVREVKKQLDLEKAKDTHVYGDDLLKHKVRSVIQEAVKAGRRLHLDQRTVKLYSAALENIIKRNFGEGETSESADKRALHDFSEKELNEFHAIYDNLRLSFNSVLKRLIVEHRNNRYAFNKITRKISDAETKETDLLVSQLREQREELEKKIKTNDDEILKLSEEIGGYHKDVSIKQKLVAELGKKINVHHSDQLKDETARRVIEELDQFISQLRIQKKELLERRIFTELKKLMHKKDFISRVAAEVSNEIIDIHLFNEMDQLIGKETLSKGEQQLYVTALLKALVSESNIKFPVFIDSPLQKFDTEHSRNIICEFYPNISDQVVLLPLLEKELTIEEYENLLPIINKVYMVKNMESDGSTFEEIEP